MPVTVKEFAERALTAAKRNKSLRRNDLGLRLLELLINNPYLALHDDMSIEELERTMAFIEDIPIYTGNIKSAIGELLKSQGQFTTDDTNARANMPEQLNQYLDSQDNYDSRSLHYKTKRFSWRTGRKNNMVIDSLLIIHSKLNAQRRKQYAVVKTYACDLEDAPTQAIGEWTEGAMNAVANSLENRFLVDFQRNVSIAGYPSYKEQLPLLKQQAKEDGISDNDIDEYVNSKLEEELNTKLEAFAEGEHSDLIIDFIKKAGDQHISAFIKADFNRAYTFTDHKNTVHNSFKPAGKSTGSIVWRKENGKIYCDITENYHRLFDGQQNLIIKSGDNQQAIVINCDDPRYDEILTSKEEFPPLVCSKARVELLIAKNEHGADVVVPVVKSFLIQTFDNGFANNNQQFQLRVPRPPQGPPPEWANQELHQPPSDAPPVKAGSKHKP